VHRILFDPRIEGAKPKRSEGNSAKFGQARERGLQIAERSLIVERVKSGMRRGSSRDGKSVVRDQMLTASKLSTRLSGMSLTAVAKKHGMSRASVRRIMQRSNEIHLPGWAESTMSVARV
jgi:DNA invertase Pin-like site-specific DNA recombinase